MSTAAKIGVALLVIALAAAAILTGMWLAGEVAPK
jgi:hypothetical protein